MKTYAQPAIRTVFAPFIRDEELPETVTRRQLNEVRADLTAKHLEMLKAWENPLHPIHNFTLSPGRIFGIFAGSTVR